MSSAVVEELLERFEEVAERLSRIVGDTERYLYFVAWLNTELERRGLGRLVVTGGFAVEVLTGAAYRTLDVDLIAEGGSERVLREFLERVADRELRVYVPRLRALASKGVDIVATVYAGRKEPLVFEVDGLRVYVEPPEELVVKYLAGWRYWGSAEDRDKAFMLLACWWDRMDREYVVSRAREEGVERELREALGVLGLG